LNYGAINQAKFHLLFFKLKNKHKDVLKTIFKHRYLHTLAKSATAEGIELLSLNGRIWNLTA